jgi:adenine phosphoribosyltransferase
METLKRTLREAPVVDRGGYQYFVHPVTDCLPEVDPELLREIATEFAKRVDADAVDKIITPEAMGIHHAAALSLELDVPFVVARKRDYGFDGEVAVHQTTGYADGKLYVNSVGEGDSLLLVDDVVSTGGTVRAMCDAVAETGAELVGALAVIERRTDDECVDLPVEVTTLLTVDVVDGEVVIVDEAAEEESG